MSSPCGICGGMSVYKQKFLLMLQPRHVFTRADQLGAALGMEVDIYKANLHSSGRVNRHDNKKHFGPSSSRFLIFKKKCIQHVCACLFDPSVFMAPSVFLCPHDITVAKMLATTLTSAVTCPIKGSAVRDSIDA